VIQWRLPSDVEPAQPDRENSKSDRGNLESSSLRREESIAKVVETNVQFLRMLIHVGNSDDLQRCDLKDAVAGLNDPHPSLGIRTRIGIITSGVRIQPIAIRAGCDISTTDSMKAITHCRCDGEGNCSMQDKASPRRGCSMATETLVHERVCVRQWVMALYAQCAGIVCMVDQANRRDYSCVIVEAQLSQC
jgi:hypothetical protein